MFWCLSSSCLVCGCEGVLSEMVVVLRWWCDGQERKEAVRVSGWNIQWWLARSRMRSRFIRCISPWLEYPALLPILLRWNRWDKMKVVRRHVLIDLDSVGHYVLGFRPGCMFVRPAGVCVRKWAWAVFKNKTLTTKKKKIRKKFDFSLYMLTFVAIF